MIHNNNQLTIAQKEVTLLEYEINKIQESDDIEDIMQLHTWSSRMTDLTNDIEEYVSLQNKPTLEFNSENLPKTILSMRIASGISQKTLAEIIGVQEQQIQRYEKQEYLTASFERVIQIMRALSNSISLKTAVNKNKADRFEKYKTQQVQEAIDKTKARKSIIDYTQQAIA